MIHPVAALFVQLIDLYSMAIFIWVTLSLLIYFNIVNAYQPFVRKLNEIFFRITEPVLKHIRRYLPNIAGLDLSPLILIIGLQFLRNMVIYYA